MALTEMYEAHIEEARCAACRACLKNCPTGALLERTPDITQSLPINGTG